jgi:hypothetical protein
MVKGVSGRYRSKSPVTDCLSRLFLSFGKTPRTSGALTADQVWRSAPGSEGLYSTGTPGWGGIWDNPAPAFMSAGAAITGLV